MSYPCGPRLFFEKKEKVLDKRAAFWYTCLLYTSNTEGKTLKVGMICIGDENDQGYTYNFIRGKEAATEARCV